MKEVQRRLQFWYVVLIDCEDNLTGQVTKKVVTIQLNSKSDSQMRLDILFMLDNISKFEGFSDN